MPHLIGLALIGAGVYAGVRAIVRIGQRVSDELRRADEERRQANDTLEKDLGALELDPATGIYRPSSR